MCFEWIGTMEDTKFILAYFMGKSYYSQNILKIDSQSSEGFWIKCCISFNDDNVNISYALHLLN